MAIPLKRLSSTPVVGPFAPPLDVPFEPLKDRSLGGVALNDTSEGLNFQTWELTLQGTDFVLTPLTTGSPVIVLSGLEGVTELGLAFDQNMNVFITYVQDERAYYYWFDPTVLDYRTVAMEETVVTPRCRYDDPRPSQVTNARIILAYCKENVLYFRTQEDRYETEYQLAEVESNLLRIGMGVNGRFQFELINPNVITTPTDTRPPLIGIPYWADPNGGRVELDLATEKTWLEVFGAAFADDNEIQANVTISENNGLTPWKIPVNTTDGGNRIRVRFNTTASNVFMAITANDGSVLQKIVWQAGGGDTADLAFPTNQQLWLVMASDNDQAQVLKRDITPDAVDQPPVIPPGGDPPPPTDVTGAIRWGTYFGLNTPFEGELRGNTADRVLPEGNRISLWFEIDPSQAPMGMTIVVVPLTTEPSPVISLNNRVGDFTQNVFSQTPSAIVQVYTVGYPNIPSGNNVVLVEPGRRYILNVKPKETGLSPNFGNRFYRFRWSYIP